MIKVGVNVNVNDYLYILLKVVFESENVFIFEELLNVGVDVNIWYGEKILLIGECLNGNLKNV